MFPSFWQPGEGFDIADLAMYAGWITVILGSILLIWKTVLKEPLARMRSYLNWMDRFRDDWDGIPPDENKPWLPHTTGVLERLNALDGEFHDNGNGSLKSSVKRIEDMVRLLAEQSQRVEDRQIGIGNRLAALDDRVAILEARRPPAA